MTCSLMPQFSNEDVVAVRVCWNKYANELDQRLHDLNGTPVSISSVDDIEKLASTIQSEIMKSYNVSCPQRKICRKTDNVW